ncbi:MAG: glycosyltransferase family 39 protein, partial [Oscillospiraceae bacterium]|nr:glycosyltransferase family 39 protein [Oscillospiraceae bacterium]
MQQKYTTLNYGHFLVAVLLFSLFLRFFVGVGYFNSYDTYWYRIWAVDLNNGLFNIYDRAESISLDYPPIYLFLLYPIGVIYKFIGTDSNQYAQMFLMKFWPIIFDVLCSLLLYFACRKYGEDIGFVAAVLWAVNPSTLFNSSMWGQTDSVMAFCLILAFWLLSQDRPLLACIIFAVAGLTKFQSL